MKREDYLKHKELIEAWANGAEIQIKNEDETWKTIEEPNWIFDKYEYRIKPKVEFPIYAKAIGFNYYVKFDSEHSGEVIVIDRGKSSIYDVGFRNIYWASVFDENSWEIIPDPYELYDKDPVWCWDNDKAAVRLLSFWDDKNKATFSFDFKRNGMKYNYYEKVLPWDMQDWMIEAQKKLED